jgi:hypothetical protein
MSSTRPDTRRRHLAALLVPSDDARDRSAGALDQNPVEVPTVSTSFPPDHDERDRDLYDRSLRAATRLLDGEPDLSVFSPWAVGFLRGMTVPGNRHIACDAMLAALDEHEAGR